MLLIVVVFSKLKTFFQWSVATGALEILCKLMESHEVCVEDFLDQQVETPGGKSVGYKPPGHTLLLHMLNETGLLKMVSMVSGDNHLFHMLVTTCLLKMVSILSSGYIFLLQNPD